MMLEPENQVAKAIERRLRDAHQRVQCRSEWSEQLIREIADQYELRETGDANSRVSKNKMTPSRRPWQFAVAAAAVLLMISGGIWMAAKNDNSNSVVANSAADGQPGGSPDGITNPQVPDLQSASANDATPSGLAMSPSPTADVVTQQLQNTEMESLTPASGYLAAQLASSDPGFEIYVVLPIFQSTETTGIQ